MPILLNKIMAEMELIIQIMLYNFINNVSNKTCVYIEVFCVTFLTTN